MIRLWGRVMDTLTRSLSSHEPAATDQHPHSLCQKRSKLLWPSKSDKGDHIPPNTEHPAWGSNPQTREFAGVVVLSCYTKIGKSSRTCGYLTYGITSPHLLKGIAKGMFLQLLEMLST